MTIGPGKYDGDRGFYLYAGGDGREARAWR